jgi:hypothetical protein
MIGDDEEALDGFVPLLRRSFVVNELFSLLINSVIRTDTPSTVIVVVVCVDDEFEVVDDEEDMDEREKSLVFFLLRILNGKAKQKSRGFTFFVDYQVF